MDKGSHRIVISGGIGSGKSYIAGLLGRAGWRHIEADLIGHAVLLPHGQAFDAVVSRWPDVLVDGRIDRRRLAGVVFGDPDELTELEAITHPAIRSEIASLVEQADSNVVVELPIGGMLPTWKRVIVDAPVTLRVERLQARGMESDDIDRRMAAQPSSDQWRETADFLFDNSDATDTESEIQRLMRWLEATS